jgi:hypothetical protein
MWRGEQAAGLCSVVVGRRRPRGAEPTSRTRGVRVRPSPVEGCRVMPHGVVCAGQRGLAHDPGSDAAVRCRAFRSHLGPMILVAEAWLRRHANGPPLPASEQAWTNETAVTQINPEWRVTGGPRRHAIDGRSSPTINYVVSGRTSESADVRQSSDVFGDAHKVWASTGGQNSRPVETQAVESADHRAGVAAANSAQTVRPAAARPSKAAARPSGSLLAARHAVRCPAPQNRFAEAQ